MRTKHNSSLIILGLLTVLVVLFTACAQTTPATTTPGTQNIAPGPTVSTLQPGSSQPAAPSASTAPTAKTTSPASKPADTTPQYGGILRYIDNFIPGQPIGTPWEANLATPAYQFAFEKVLGVNLDGTEAPELVASWDVDTSADSPSITLHIRKGVKFHDGTDLNAQAVKWNLDMVKNGNFFPGCRVHKSYDVIDDYTVKVPLTEWRNTIPPLFTQIQGYIVSPNAYAKNGLEWMRWNQVGTGPFVQVAFNRDANWKFVRNDNYWQAGKPYLMGVDDIFVSDETTRIALWKSGGGDIMGVSARYAAEFQKQGEGIVGRIGSVQTLMPDGMNPTSPWSNKKVREAAEYAIDREGLAKAYGYGFNLAAYQLPSSDCTAYSPDITGRKYDPEKAKQLLAEAGYPGGFKTKIISPVQSDQIIAVKAMLDAVGIIVDLDFPQSAKFATYMAGTWDNACLWGSVVQIANYNMTFNNFLSSPPALYKSVKMPDNWPQLFKDTLTSKTVEPKLQQKAIKAIYDECSVIPLYYNTNCTMVSSKLRGSNIGKLFYWGPQDIYFVK